MKKYFLYLIVVGVVYFIGNGIFEQMAKKAKSQRLDCHQNVTVFEKIYIKDKIKILQDNIKQGTVGLHIDIQKAQYAKSVLLDVVDIKNLETKLLEIFGIKSNNKDVYINLLVYENDKSDAKKKNDDAKKYAGYLMFDCFVGGDIVYKIQIDFNKMTNDDINQQILCAYNSIMTIKDTK